MIFVVSGYEEGLFLPQSDGRVARINAVLGVGNAGCMSYDIRLKFTSGQATLCIRPEGLASHRSQGRYFMSESFALCF
jgi:hypothetical protein